MTSKLPSHFYLDKTLAFIDQVVYCPDEYKWALTAALAVSHAKYYFSAVPFILATGEFPSSGKSTIAYDLPLLLADNIESIDRTTTQPAMNNMFLLRETPNTAWDDIGKIFGPNGTNGALSSFYTLLVRSYKKNATTKVSRNGAMVRLSTYGMAFLNGLQNAVPKDLFTRCIHFKMTEAPDFIELRDVMDESAEADARLLKEALHGWANSHGEEFRLFMKGKVRRVHKTLAKRRRQKWGPLFAVADAAGGQWPQRIFDAYIMIELDAGEKPTLLPEQFAVLDAAQILCKSEATGIFTSDLIEALRALPAGQYYRDVEDDHLVNRVFPAAFGKTERIRGTMIYGPHAGRQGQAAGYDAANILTRAIALREMLYPPMTADAPDPLDEALAFEPTPTPAMITRRVA